MVAREGKERLRGDGVEQRRKRQRRDRRRKKDAGQMAEVGEAAVDPASTYAAVFGTEPTAVASRNGVQPIRETAAQ